MSVLKERLKLPVMVLIAVVTVLFRNALYPFIFAYILAFLLRKVILFIMNVTGLNSKISGCVCLIICYGCALVSFIFVVRYAIYTLSEFAKILPEIYVQKIEPFLKDVENKIYGLSNDNIRSVLTYIYGSIKHLALNSTSEISRAIGKCITELFIRLPEYITTATISVIASFFICIDYENITKGIFKHIPINIRDKFDLFRKMILNSLIKMCYSYFLIFLITFFELLIGLYLLKVEYFFVISFIIAIIDIFPMLGTATILIPWAIACFINKNSTFAIGLLVLMFIIMIVRNVIEPKIIGKTTGLHPLVALFAMYFGLKIGGIACAVLFPFIFYVLYNLYQTNKKKEHK